MAKSILFCLAMVCASGTILAATRSWTGNASVFWSNPNNWDPAGAPQTGDSLFFPSSASRYTSQNDLPPPVRLTRMELAGGGYHLTGTNVILETDFTDSHSNGDPNRVSFFLYFSGAATVNVTGSQQGELLEIYGQIRAGASEDITISVNAGALELHDALVGSGAVIKRGNGALRFSSGNPNVYYRGMYVLEGTAYLDGNKPVYAETGTGRLIVGSNGVSQATVYVGSTPWAGQVGVEINDSHLQFDHATGVHFLTLREGAVVDGDGSLTVYGSIEGSSDVLTPVIKLPLDIYAPFTGFNIHGANYSGLDIQTPIGGPGGISKIGDAALLLRYSNSFTGNVSVIRGILDASGPNALGQGTNVGVHGGGALTLRNIAVTGKTLDVSTPDHITADLVGTRLTVIGAASWSGPVMLRTNLVVLGGDMDFTGPISGPGGMFFLNGISTLAGADANTFTGPTVARGSLLKFGKPSGVRAFSSPLIVGGPFGGPYEARWLQDYQNVYADVTLFANGLVNLNGHREDFGPLTFHGGEITTGTGELGLYGLVTVNAESSIATIDGRLGLPPGFHEFRVHDGTAFPDLRVGARVLGAGHLRKTGAGQMWLTESNSYQGLTTVAEGALSVLNPFGLGASDTGTTVNDGATLEVNFTGGIMPEPLAIRGTGAYGIGALAAFGDATLRNPFPSIFAAIDLTSDTMINVAPNSRLTVNGFISGTGPLTKTGPGTLVLANINPNTYSGDTFVNEGVLNLSKPNLAISVPGNLIVGPAPLNSSAVARWSTSGGMNPGAIATINAGSLLDLNGNAQTLSRLNLNDGGDAQTGAGILNFGFGGMVAVGSLNQLGSHAGSTFNGNIGLPANATLTFAVGAYAPTAPFDFNPELNVSANIAAPAENPNFERAGIAKTGPGTMRLIGNTSFHGRVEVLDGTLIAANGTALGSTFDGTFVQNNARLALEGSSNFEGEILVLNTAATPALENLSGENYWSGQVIMQRHSTIGTRASSLLQLAGVISGSANFTKAGPGTLRFGGGGHNTYSGETFINEGVFLMSKPLAVTAVPGPLSIGTPAGLFATAANLTSYQVVGNIFVNRNGLLNLNGQVENVDHLWLMEGGDVQTTTGILSVKTGGSIQVLPGMVNDPATISGILEFLAGAHNINVAASTTSTGGPDLDITALVTSAGQAVTLHKLNNGKMRLSANNDYVGATVVNGGVLQVDGSQPTSSVIVNDGARLIGTGRTGPVTFGGPSGVVAPGASPGTLQVGHFNSDKAGGILQIELNGSTPGVDYDRLSIGGFTDLERMSLQVTVNFAAAIGQQFLILQNDLVDAIIGEFINWPQDDEMRIGDHVFHITYTGGDGNDVVLTKIADVYRPLLRIQRIAPSSVRLLWPTNDPAFTLQFNTNLSSASWNAASPAPSITGTNFTISDAMGGVRKFYRLFRP